MTNNDLRAIDAPLRDLTDNALARPLPAGLVGAREDIIAAAHDLLAIPESSLASDWPWTGESQADIRYGAYRAAEALELAEVEARAVLAASDAGDTLAGETRAARIIGPSTAARWDLHGLLLPLDEALLDAAPGGEDWTIRLTVGHVIEGQRSYGWGTAWWQAQGFDVADSTMPATLPDGFWDTLPDDPDEAVGSLVDVMARFDVSLDHAAERMAGLPDDRVMLGSRWAGFPVTIAFRLGRWASHIREHTIQVEKTFAMLGHVPSEPARLVRNLLAAYGRAESVVFGRDPGSGDAMAAAVGRLVAGAGEARAAIASARAQSERITST